MSPNVALYFFLEGMLSQFQVFSLSFFVHSQSLLFELALLGFPVS